MSTWRAFREEEPSVGVGLLGLLPELIEGERTSVAAFSMHITANRFNASTSASPRSNAAMISSSSWVRGDDAFSVFRVLVVNTSGS